MARTYESLIDDKIEQGLLANEREGSDINSSLNLHEFIEETKRIGYITGPMVAVHFSQYFLQIISVVMVGHLGQLSLSSIAITVSFGAVTGFSVLFGMSGALETLCGQAYGAQQYGKLGTHTYTAILSLIVACLPLTALWVYMGKLFILIGQDPVISEEAGKLIICLIPALYAYATLQPIIRFFQTQSLIMPLLVSSCSSLCFHVLLCWGLVFKSGLGNQGAALAISISYWTNVISLGLYMMFSDTCSKTLAPITIDVFRGVQEFFRLAIPSASMICLEWWSFELLIIFSGFLPNPQLETSVTSVCLATMSTLFPIPEGIGAAASTRVSNELGAGNPRSARIAVFTALLIALLESVTVGAALFFSRHVFGYVFSNDKEVIDYVTNRAPLLSLSVVLDSLQVVLSGIARGSGWQDLGAYINLAAYYLCGIPVAVVLGFWVKMRGKGLWIGLQAGSFLQVLLLSAITSCIDWHKQARKARDRLLASDVETQAQISGD
ncbi:protein DETOXIFICATION 14-like [Gossypium arboreum]|uniref:Protein DETOXIFICATION n=1 Tax=Gossypium arboreum TaxID=29729 RepID=A0ABR0Q3I8_GOSAR|nr:protein DETOXIFICATION 14-like [Gossypium arboreum]KAK5833616.1 hypothetical protein PVK06_017468 [Gossypium arboreum]